jgi:transposase-like protein
VRVRHPKETDVKKSRFSEAQIIAVLREQEAGGATDEVCRRHGISQQTFYRWTQPKRNVLRRSPGYGR